MKKKYDLAVFIGRFQIFHNGHKTVIDRALEEAEQVIVLIGSSYQPRSFRNPFTYDERAKMIYSVYMNTHRVSCVPLVDYMYNDELWIKQVQDAVTKFDNHCNKNNICLIGYAKDHTSYYLNLFPNWDSVNVEQKFHLNSTNLRTDYFSTGMIYGVPDAVINFLEEFKEWGRDYNHVKEEYECILKYKKQWEAAPYPPIFVTVDACVIQSGHVLLVERGAAPGKGLWALPGGFLDQNELIVDGMVRELKEETGIKVPIPVIKGSIKDYKVFDNPQRSARGRTITHGYLVHLSPGALPKVRGADDAAKAKWIPLSDVDPEKMFEDHFAIIEHFSNKI